MLMRHAAANLLLPACLPELFTIVLQVLSSRSVHTARPCGWADANLPQSQHCRRDRHIAHNSGSPSVVGRHQAGLGLPWSPLQEMMWPKDEEKGQIADDIFCMSQTCTKLIEDGEYQQALDGLQMLLCAVPNDPTEVSSFLFKAGFGPDGFDALSHFGLHSKIGDAQVGLEQYKEAVESYKTAAEAVVPTMAATLSLMRAVR